MYYGIGKKKALNIAGKFKLLFLGQAEANEDQY